MVVGTCTGRVIDEEQESRRNLVNLVNLVKVFLESMAWAMAGVERQSCSRPHASHHHHLHWVYFSFGAFFQLPLCVSIQLHHNTKYDQQQKLLKGFYVSFHRYVELEFHIRSWFSHCDWLVGLSRDEKREGGMAGPGFSRLEASFEDYFHWNKKVSGVWTGWACLWRTWEGRRGEKREPWVDSGEK